MNLDVHEVRDGEVVATVIDTKPRAIYAVAAVGTEERAIERERQRQPALTDAQVVRLAMVGRPITTLFPVPAANDDQHHVYVSVGHGQMMTDAMKPLGLSFFKLTALPPMHEAGGRLFVDVTARLASPSGRAGLLEVLGRGDPLIGDALRTIVGRGDFLRSVPDETPAGGGPAASGPAASGPMPMSTPIPTPIETDPAIVDELIAHNQASVAALQRDIRTKSGTALLDFILADIQELKRILFDPRSTQAIMAGMEATWWLNDQLQVWLGEKNAADTLTRSVPHNVTSEMGLALLDVADVIRPHPEVVAFLRHVEGDDFLDELVTLAGGREARDAIRAYLDRYGMRCVGEIDITRPRWSERPSTLVPIILANVRNFEPGAGRRRYEEGRQEASMKEQELLERLHALPDGPRKADKMKRMIDRVRIFSGYREYPKYGMVSRYFVYKQALLGEADRLVQTGVLREKDDIFSLTFAELHDVVRTNRVDHDLIGQRKDAFTSYQALTPPRVLTSDGEVVVGAYGRDDVPAGALVGLPVSAGTIEGRARVIVDIADADLEPGDILVTAYTDPSWTPLFVSIAGLVTEVGGLMTHGAVIAREYGLPAVVGVERASALIKDGQRIRLHGTDGYVELLA